ncbi:hypothetical protein ACE7GA_22775 [Roseomonas sp. CCTCC AB2023176]|uniref:hypothetical protein n=1 Tax=Roseomonas sp. CCTCC AB2023176 TaxID=3342640 RepID=UPI0035D5DAB9
MPPAAFAILAGGLVLLGVGLALGGSFLAFGAGWLLPGAPAAIALLLAATLSAWLLLGVGHRQRAQIRRSFEHYMDPRLVGRSSRRRCRRGWAASTARSPRCSPTSRASRAWRKACRRPGSGNC